MNKSCIPCELLAVVLVASLVTSLQCIPRLALAAESDTLTRSVQSALHARGFYYGTVTGRADPSTVEALRRFQIRQGLPVSGSPDKATLQALGLASSGDAPPTAAPPASTPAPPPPPPPSPSPLPSPPQDADRELLRREGLTQPAAPVTRRPTPTPRPRKAPSPLSLTASPAALAPGSAAPPNPRSVAVAPSPVPAPRPTPAPPATKTDQARRDEPASSAAAVGTFVRRYFVRGAADKTDAEIAFFADPVDYFNSGRIQRIFIRRDIEAYHRRWPERHFDLEGEPVVTRTAGDGVVTVRFRLAYRLQSPREHASGRTDNEMRLRPGGPEGFEILSVRERKL